MIPLLHARLRERGTAHGEPSGQNNSYEPVTPVTGAPRHGMVMMPPTTHDDAMVTPQRSAIDDNDYQPTPSYGYEPHSYASYGAPAATLPGGDPQDASAESAADMNSHGGGSYEPATYGYEPPSYHADPDLGPRGQRLGQGFFKGKIQKERYHVR